MTDFHRFDTIESGKSTPIGIIPGTVIANRYRLLETIGEGGMGSVWMAEQREPVRRRVALKLIKPGMDSKAVLARFDAERQALAMMDHPNIAKVFDGGMTEQGLPFFVMELVKGIPLMQYCDERKLSICDRLELFIQICQAVQHAHQKGIIHRDLKPSNILVTEMDGQPVPKVIDFGLAKALQGAHTLTDQTLYTVFGGVVGTPLYMAPEQVGINALDVDTRTDVYSLGVILYELLTGTTPVESKQLKQAAWDEIRRIIREEDPPKPSTRLSSTEALPSIAASRHTEATKLGKLVRGDLDWIVMKCLDKDRSRRYETATGLALDVQRHLSGDAVIAAPPTAAYRIQKFVRRNRNSVSITSLLLIAAVGGTGAYVRGIRSEKTRTEAALRVAEVQRGRAEDALKTSEKASRRARHAAAMSDSRYLVQQSQLPAAIARAAEAWKLGDGKWEDGYLLDEIYNSSRRQWTLIGRLDLNTSAYAGCVTRIGDRDYLALAESREVQLYDARTCEQLVAVPLEGIELLVATKQPIAPATSSSPSAQPARAGIQTGMPTVVFAVAGTAITALEVPSLKKLATKQYSSKIYRMATNAFEALIVQQDGMMRVIDAATLEDRSTLDWPKLKGAETTAPSHVGISPGGRVMAHGGSWWNKPLVWDRARPGQPESQRWLECPGMGVFDFLDDTHCVIWNHNSINGTVTDELFVYLVAEKLETVRHQNIRVVDVLSGERTGVSERIQAWNSNGQMYAGVLSPDFGCAVSQLKSGESQSWRYGELWPINDIRSDLLCQDLEHSLLVLRTGSTVQIFDQNRYAWGDNNITGYTSTPCETGMLRVWGLQPQVGLTFTPYARSGQTRRMTLQWLTGDNWIPWSVASTPDASTVVVMAQPASGFGRVGDRFGRLCAVVYRPGEWSSTPPTWAIANQFELDVPPPMNGWARRLTVLDPAGNTLLYTSSYSQSVRYSVASGQKLNAFATAGWVTRTSDGKLLAGIDEEGNLFLTDVSTGRCTDLAGGYKGIKGICFSADGSHLVVYLTAQIHCHEVATGRELWVRKARIIPLAWPAEGGDRYVGYREDRGRGGSIVLADTETCEPVALLSSSGEFASEAYFSPSGRELMLNFSRWRADVLRLISPEQLLADLQRPEHAWHQPLPAAAPAIQTAKATVTSTTPSKVLAGQPIVHLADSNEDISNRSALESHMGAVVSAEATIDRVSLTRQHNALIVNLESRAPDRIIVWIPPNIFAQVKESWGKDKDFLSMLPHRRIQVRGQLSHYQGSIEISLSGPEDWRFLDAPSVASRPQD